MAARSPAPSPDLPSLSGALWFHRSPAVRLIFSFLPPLWSDKRPSPPEDLKRYSHLLYGRCASEWLALIEIESFRARVTGATDGNYGDFRGYP